MNRQRRAHHVLSNIACARVGEKQEAEAENHERFKNGEQNVAQEAKSG